MIKGKPPFPFETIGLAVSFSPGLPFLVSEMCRMCNLHNALAVFIHAGKKTSEKQRIFSELLNVNGFHDGNSRIYWEHGETVISILQVCKHEVVDLLLAGVSERENFNLPAGKIASGIATKAKCSVLLYTGIESKGFKNIVVNGNRHDKTDSTVLTSIYFAEKEDANEIKVVTDSKNSDYVDIPDLLIQKANPSINIKTGDTDFAKITIRKHSLSEENCTSLTEFAFKNQADLLITHSSDHRLSIFDRVSSANSISTLLKELTCNLLIIHSRFQS